MRAGVDMNGTNKVTVFKVCQAFGIGILKVKKCLKIKISHVIEIKI